ncbi:legumain-like [Pygocentrus nattereri]|uniref:legumain n=1 Tax=Pygocentrus nattereri TaxID=42514 RepID=A0A3B4C4Y9_PYGNA|nr:legumain-like [Pygocentrus nattereri]
MGSTQSKHWVLLAAGAKGWDDYRHQACVCHAYQVARRNGIPDEQIVVMMYDDIAYNQENRYQGQIINVPNGPNVYQGVPKDYTGDDVSAKNFLAILRGDEAGVDKQTRGPKRVLNSGQNDTVFVYLSGHGGPGLFAFPTEDLHAFDLVDTVKKMSTRQQFSKMVIYVESCFSGSMIHHLPKNAQVYGVSAATPDEPSYACFFDEDRCTCLSNEFSSQWLLHLKMHDLNCTTFQNQFDYLKTNVRLSTPCQYGNNELSRLFISNILGCPDSRTLAASISRAERVSPTHLTPSHNVTLIIKENRIRREKDLDKKRALQRDYHKLLQTRSRFEKAVSDIAKHSCPRRGPRALSERRSLTRLEDMKKVAEHFRLTFSEWHEEQDDCCVLQHMHIFVSLIESGVDVARIKAAITHVRLHS